jgi:hypothetical protein
MIRINDDRLLTLLFTDVLRVYRLASKEFEVVNYSFEFDSRKRRVRCVRFSLEFRNAYYCSVYPNQVELFNSLDMLKRNSANYFVFVRHSITTTSVAGVDKYSVVLWY